MEEFLSLNGLRVLLEALNSQSQAGHCHSFSEAVLSLELVNCIKAVINSKAGLEFLINSYNDSTALVKSKFFPSTTFQIDLADSNTKYSFVLIFLVLETSNASVKIQVFELLCAVAVYNQKGHACVLEGMEAMRILKKLRFRFSLIIEELKQTDVISYQTTLISFVNCIILGCCDDLRERIRIRREFKSKFLEWMKLCVPSKLLRPENENEIT